MSPSLSAHAGQAIGGGAGLGASTGAQADVPLSARADPQLPTGTSQSPSGTAAHSAVEQGSRWSRLGYAPAPPSSADGEAPVTHAARPDALVLVPPLPGSQGLTVGPPAGPVDDASPTQGQGREPGGHTESESESESEFDPADEGWGQRDGATDGPMGMDRPPLSFSVPYPGMLEALGRVRPLPWFVAGAFLMAVALIVWGST